MQPAQQVPVRWSADLTGVAASRRLSFSTILGSAAVLHRNRFPGVYDEDRPTNSTKPSTYPCGVLRPNLPTQPRTCPCGALTQPTNPAQPAPTRVECRPNLPTQPSTYPCVDPTYQPSPASTYPCGVLTQPTNPAQYVPVWSVDPTYQPSPACAPLGEMTQPTLLL